MVDIARDCLRALLADNADSEEIMQLYTPAERFVRWKILSLRFNNILAYGPDNFIRFPIRAVYGKNFSGKTSLMDIIAYALYGSPIRGDCANIASASDTPAAVFTQITIEAAGRMFIITRERSSSKTLATMECVLGGFKDSASGESKELILVGPKELISDDVRTIGAKVESMIGPLRYILATAINIGSGDLLNLKPTDRINLFAEICGLNGHKELIRAAKTTIKSLEETRFALKMPRIESPRERLEALLSEEQADIAPGDNMAASELIARAKMNNMGLSRDEFDQAVARRNELIAQRNQLPMVDKPAGDRATVTKNLSMARAGIKKFTAELESIDIITEDNLDLNLDFNLNPNTNFITATADIHTKLEKISAGRALLKLAPVDDGLLRHLREEYSTAGKFTYSIDCTHCARNREIFNGEDYKSRIAAEEARLAGVRENNASIEAKLLALQALETKLLASKSAIEAAERKRLRRECLIADIEKLKIIEERYNEAHESFLRFDTAGGNDIIERAAAIDAEISKLPRGDTWIDSAGADRILADYAEWETRRARRNAEIQILREDLPLADNAAIAAELASKINIYSQLISIAGNSRFPLMVISKYADQIQSVANSTLDSFGMKLTIIPGEKSLDLSIEHNNTKIPLELCSGMQRLIISTALRIALRDICPCGEQIFVDECGVIAAENMAAFLRLPVIPLISTMVDSAICIVGSPSKINNGTAEDTPTLTLKKPRQPRRKGAIDTPAVPPEMPSEVTTTEISSGGVSPEVISAPGISTDVVSAPGVSALGVSLPVVTSPAPVIQKNIVQRNTTITCGCGATIRESYLGIHITSKKHQAWMQSQAQS